VWTIGHSTRTIEEVLHVLAVHRVEPLAHVRRLPGSRRQPHFSRESLQASLAAVSIAYQWLPQLGGRRSPRKDSPNTGWRNPSFRGYADHLDSAEFAEGLAMLIALAAGRRTALMCSELLWWRCHRSLISDVLLARGIEVMHIAGTKAPVPHAYTQPARLVEGRLGYALPGTSDLFGPTD
jgi:uncharacterized protein (DUF488 family)